MVSTSVRRALSTAVPCCVVLAELWGERQGQSRTELLSVCVENYANMCRILRTVVKYVQGSQDTKVHSAKTVIDKESIQLYHVIPS